jgi:hypothetical protein
MVMKKASGSDSPLWQGAGKSFWTLPILRRRWWRLAVCFMEIDQAFRFSHRGEYIGVRAASEGGPGGHTTWWRSQGLGRTTLWCAWPLVPLRLSFGLCLVSGKIGTLAFVSSNYENISYVAFLKHKTAENRELALWRLVSRLVPKNA